MRIYALYFILFFLSVIIIFRSGHNYCTSHGQEEKERKKKKEKKKRNGQLSM
jgi:hypothetical protein